MSFLKSIKLFNNGRRHVGHNGEAAPRVCVPANEVSALIGLLVATLIHPRVTAELCAQYSLTFDE